MMPSDIIKVRHTIINGNVKEDINILSISDIHISSSISYEKLSSLIYNLNTQLLLDSLVIEIGEINE